MKDEHRSRLESLFGDLRETRAAQEARRSAEAEKAVAVHGECRDVLESTVAPVLRALAGELRALGHDVHVGGCPEPPEAPCVRFSYRVDPDLLGRLVPNQELSFEFHGARGVDARERLLGSNAPGVLESRKACDVDAEWVESLAVRFVEHATKTAAENG